MTNKAADIGPISPLSKLRDPFPENQISKLPKETGAQSKQRKADQDAGKWPAKCEICGGFHHPCAVHLDYVGHAAATDRLLDTDLEWSWEPMAVTAIGLPAFDNNNGLWIKLTVCGVTRIGYGSAGDKTGGDAIKEIIGDSLRNAGMRFGMALDLWHKGVLHVDDSEEETSSKTPSAVDMAINLLRGCGDSSIFKEAWSKNHIGWKGIMDPADYARVQEAKNECVAKLIREAEEAKAKAAKTPNNLGIMDDEIPF